MDLGLVQGIYSNKLEGNATGIYDNINTGLHNGLYNENIINNVIVKNGLVLYLDAANPYSSPYATTTWIDLSVKSNNGTLTNGASYNTLNKGVIAFDGINDFVNCGNPLDLQFTSLTPFSISGWFYCSSIPSIASIFDKYSLTNIGYRLIYGSVWNGKMLLSINSYNITSNTVLNTNRWYNFAYIYNHPSLILYINGLLDGTFTSTSSLLNNTINFNIGRSEPLGQYLPGYISNIQIYNRMLTASEINQNYQSTKSRFNL